MEEHNKIIERASVLLSRSLTETASHHHAEQWLSKYFSDGFANEVRCASEKANRLRAEAASIELRAAQRVVEAIAEEWSADEIAAALEWNALKR